MDNLELLLSKNVILFDDVVSIFRFIIDNKEENNGKYHLNFNSITLLRKIRNKKGRINIRDKFYENIEASYAFDIYNLSKDMINRLSNISERKIKPTINSYEDSYLHTTITIIDGLLKIIDNTEKEYLLSEDSYIYQEYLYIVKSLISHIESSDDRNGKVLRKLYIVKKGLNSNYNQDKISNLIIYKDRIYDIIRNEASLSEPWKSLYKKNRIFLKGSFSSYNLEHIYASLNSIAKPKI